LINNVGARYHMPARHQKTGALYASGTRNLGDTAIGVLIHLNVAASRQA